MTVIVMAQEIGSRGDEIAAAIAERLRLELVCRKRLARGVAERSRIGEDTVRRVMDGNASWLDRWTTDRHWLRQCVAEQVVSLAARGSVLIQDRGAAQLLRPIRHIICVRFWAPAGTGQGSRVARAARLGAARRETMATWDAYHLAINAERLSVAQCVEQVVRLARNPQFQQTTASRHMLASLARDIDRTPRSTLDPLQEWAPRDLDVEVGSQTIRLAGMTSSEQAIARIEQHLHGSKATIEASVHSLPPSGGLS